ncbi:MAG: hypothetical protein BWY37_02013 [Firmicutes bacterium ADurb.Bin262]|nr:MAG: hypothetical protein BWY37_02013 [Firmicutes bacterium ADurb.Bin262]
MGNPFGVQLDLGPRDGRQVVDALKIVVDHRALRARRPADKRIAGSDKSVGRQVDGRIVGNGLVGHRAAGGSVTVKDHIVGVRCPLREKIEFPVVFRRQVDDALRVSVGRLSLVLPTAECIAGFCESVGRQVLGDIIGVRRIAHRAACVSVAVIFYGVSVGRPFRIERLVAVGHQERGVLRIRHRAARGRRPAGEGVAQAQETVGVEQVRRSVDQVLRRRRAGRRAVAVEGDGAVMILEPCHIDGPVTAVAALPLVGVLAANIDGACARGDIIDFPVIAAPVVRAAGFDDLDAFNGGTRRDIRHRETAAVAAVCFPAAQIRRLVNQGPGRVIAGIHPDINIVIGTAVKTVDGIVRHRRNIKAKTPVSGCAAFKRLDTETDEADQ